MNSLHLHIVDLSDVGPSYDALRFKNLAMDTVLEALQKEIDALQPKPVRRPSQLSRRQEQRRMGVGSTPS